MLSSRCEHPVNGQQACCPSKCFAQRFCLLVVVERVQTKLTELGVSHKSGSAFPSFVCTGRLLGRKGSLRKERTEVVDWPSRAELSFACFCLSLVWDPLHNPLKLSSNIGHRAVALQKLWHRDKQCEEYGFSAILAAKVASFAACRPYGVIYIIEKILVMCSARLGSPRPSKPSHGKPSFSGPCSRLWSAHGSGFSTQEPWAAASATAFCG